MSENTKATSVDSGNLEIQNVDELENDFVLACMSFDPNVAENTIEVKEIPKESGSMRFKEAQKETMSKAAKNIAGNKPEKTTKTTKKKSEKDEDKDKENTKTKAKAKKTPTQDNKEGR